MSELDPVKFLSAPGLAWQTGETDEGYFLEVDVQYTKKLHELHNDLPFLSERMKIEQVEKLKANFHDKTECVIHIGNLKQTLNYELDF